ncbi:MAG: glycerophosphodiester phosphodiesterase [Acidobacteriota bacterium]|nr:glycerophosphodiester phosphodiesterase [Acidobacteriota bacterium]
MRPANDSRPPVFQSPRPLVFAHRGGARLAPENTIPAFDNGFALGADGFELDVQLSSDGIPVVIHDHTLERTTDHTGPVHALTADDLARVDAGHRFEHDGVFTYRGRGIGIPRLDAVLARYPDARIIIEMKGGQPELASAVAREVRRASAVDRVCVGSFYQRSIATLRAEAPEIVTSASQPEARWTLHRSWVRWPWIGPRPYVAFQVPEFAGRMRVVSPAFVRQVHREGQVLQVWVVNDEADIIRLLEWGVDGVISDRPDIAVSTAAAWYKKRQ